MEIKRRRREIKRRRKEGGGGGKRRVESGLSIKRGRDLILI